MPQFDLAILQSVWFRRVRTLGIKTSSTKTYLLSQRFCGARSNRKSCNGDFIFRHSIHHTFYCRGRRTWDQSSSLVDASHHLQKKIFFRIFLSFWLRTAESDELDYNVIIMVVVSLLWEIQSEWYIYICDVKIRKEKKSERSSERSENIMYV